MASIFDVQIKPIDGVKTYPKSTIGQTFFSTINQVQDERLTQVMADSYRFNNDGVAFWDSQNNKNTIKEEDWNEDHKYYRTTIDNEGNVKPLLDWHDQLTFIQAKRSAESFDIRQRYEQLKKRETGFGTAVRWTTWLGTEIFGDEATYATLGAGTLFKLGSKALFKTGQKIYTKKTLGQKVMNQLWPTSPGFRKSMQISAYYGGAYGGLYASQLNDAREYRGQERLSFGDLATITAVSTIAPAAFTGLVMGAKKGLLATLDKWGSNRLKKEAEIKNNLEKTTTNIGEGTYNVKPRKVEKDLPNSNKADVEVKDVEPIINRNATVKAFDKNGNEIVLTPENVQRILTEPQNTQKLFQRGHIFIFEDPTNANRLILRVRTTNDLKTVLNKDSNLVKNFKHQELEVQISKTVGRKAKSNKAPFVFTKSDVKIKPEELVNRVTKLKSNQVKKQVGKQTQIFSRVVDPETKQEYFYMWNSKTNEFDVYIKTGKDEAKLDSATAKKIMTKLHILDANGRARAMANELKNNVDSNQRTDNIFDTLQFQRKENAYVSPKDAQTSIKDFVEDLDHLAFTQIFDEFKAVLNKTLVKELDDAGQINTTTLGDFKFDKVIKKSDKARVGPTAPASDIKRFYTQKDGDGNGRLLEATKRDSEGNFVKSKDDLDRTDELLLFVKNKFQDEAIDQMNTKVNIRALFECNFRKLST